MQLKVTRSWVLSGLLGLEPNAMRTRRYSFPFPVADTEEGPTLVWRDFELVLQFRCYLGDEHTVTFKEVLHFELVSESELDARVFPIDGVVELLDSEIKSKLAATGEILASKVNKFRHIVIGFNEVGSYLIVVFSALAAR